MKGTLQGATGVVIAVSCLFSLAGSFHSIVADSRQVFATYGAVGLSDSQDSPR